MTIIEVYLSWLPEILFAQLFCAPVTAIIILGARWLAERSLPEE